MGVMDRDYLQGALPALGGSFSFPCEPYIFRWDNAAATALHADELPLRLNWRRYGTINFGCLVLGALILAADWRPSVPLGWGLLGVAAGLLLSLDVMRLLGPRAWEKLPNRGSRPR